MNLTKTNWPLGWQPSSDPLNGNPAGLQRMDNLHQDEEGCLALVKGLRQVNTHGLSNYVDSMYSRNIGGTEAIWVGLGASGTDIVRSLKGDFSDSVSLGAGTNRVCFGSAYGQVIAIGGQTRKKDNGGTVINNLGLLTPDVPGIVPNTQPILNITGSWTVNEGISGFTSSSAITGAPNTTSLRSVLTLSDAVNCLNIGGNTATDPSNDLFQFKFSYDDSSAVQSVQLIIQLSSTDFYTFTWTQDDLIGGPSQTCILSAVRSAFSPNTGLSRHGFKRIDGASGFTRSGSNITLDWKNVTSFQFVVNLSSVINFTIDAIKFIGGTTGQLNGVYNYVQVNVNDNGFYVAKSPPSLATSPVTLINGSSILTPSATEAQVTECWFFRTTVAGSQVGNQNSFLDQYYRVATCKPGSTVVDTISDTDAITLDITLNPFLKSLNASDINGIKDDIFSVEGMYFERMLYMTFGQLLLSDRLNPDAVDSRYTVRISGDATEYNIAIKQLTNNVLILFTNKNSYEITGTLEDLPDGTVDINVIPIGEQYPILGTAGTIVCSVGGGIYYRAADGIRVTNGSNSQLISPELRLLFQGQSRVGLAPVVVTPYSEFAIAVGKTKLFARINLTDGTRWLFIFDLIKKVWRLQDTDPVSIHVTPTDRVLLGFDDLGVGDIFELDKGVGVQDASGNILEGLGINFQTVFDDNQQPRNRKDTFTLKIVAETGGRNCTVNIGYTTAASQDEENTPAFQTVGTINSTGKQTFYFPLDSFTLGFKYALQIKDTLLLTSFHLYEYTIEYDPRPEQLDYLRIQPDNLGTDCRKRIVNYPFVIDTLGNNITFQPYVDGIATGTPLVFNTPRKQTVIFYFQAETIGTDFFGIFSGGVFEFYGVLLGEITSEKLPVPCEYLVIPSNDYGTPNRKRHSSFKFQILTRGKNVQFTPRLDGQNYPVATYNTTEKRVVEYFFTSDTIAIDIGGHLQTIEATPFEFYGVITPQQIEQLPDRLEYFRIPNSNFEIAARKRVRTIPLVIDTYGKNVQFNPIVDGITYPSTILNSSGKTTLWHYFNFDTFGIDYGGELISLQSQPFEFYGLGQLETVESLPVGKLFDQLGPMRFDKIGKIFGFRIRLISTGDSSIPFQFLGDDDSTVPAYSANDYSGFIPSVPNTDNVYDIKLPKNINLTMCRLVIGPSQFPFHRYDCQIRVGSSGMETDQRWIPIR